MRIHSTGVWDRKTRFEHGFNKGPLSLVCSTACHQREPCTFYLKAFNSTIAVTWSDHINQDIFGVSEHSIHLNLMKLGSLTKVCWHMQFYIWLHCQNECVSTLLLSGGVRQLTASVCDPALHQDTSVCRQNGLQNQVSYSSTQHVGQNRTCTGIVEKGSAGCTFLPVFHVETRAPSTAWVAHHRDGTLHILVISTRHDNPWTPENNHFSHQL